MGNVHKRIFIAVTFVILFSGVAAAQNPGDKLKEERWDDIRQKLMMGTTFEKETAISNDIARLRDPKPLLSSPWNLLDEIVKILKDKKADIRLRSAVSETIIKLIKIEKVYDEHADSLRKDIEKVFEDEQEPVYLRTSLVKSLGKLAKSKQPRHRTTIALIRKVFNRGKNAKDRVELRGNCLVALTEIGENVEREAKAALVEKSEIYEYAITAIRIMIKNKDVTIKGDGALFRPLMLVLKADIFPEQLIDVCFILQFLMEKGKAKESVAYEPMMKMAGMCIKKDYPKAFQAVLNVLNRISSEKEKIIKFMIEKAESDGSAKMREKCVDALGEYFARYLKTKKDSKLIKRISGCMVDLLSNEATPDSIKARAAYAVFGMKRWMNKLAACEEIVNHLLSGIHTGLLVKRLDKTRVKKLQEALVESWKEKLNTDKELRKKLRGEPHKKKK